MNDENICCFGKKNFPQIFPQKPCSDEVCYVIYMRFRWNGNVNQYVFFLVDVYRNDKNVISSIYSFFLSWFDLKNIVPFKSFFFLSLSLSLIFIDLWLGLPFLNFEKEDIWPSKKRTKRGRLNSEKMYGWSNIWNNLKALSYLFRNQGRLFALHSLKVEVFVMEN